MPSSHLPIRPESAGRALPERLRRSLETLSGYDLSDVRVHGDSVLPEQVGARAFAHGSDIYLERGAEEVLAHEAWHVVQQKQGRVRATRELGSAAERLGNSGLNDDGELEAEAEVMGRFALLLSLADIDIPHREGLRVASVGQPSVQRHVEVGAEAYADLSELRVEVANAQQLSFGNVIGLSEILSDILDEDLTFDSWASLAREIRIREVGYQAEAALRELLVVSRRNYGPAAPQARACEEEENTLYANELDLPLAQRTYQTKNQLKEGIKQKKAKLYVDGNVFRWSAPTAFSGELRPIKNYHIYRWLSGTLKTPTEMNCWEIVLYALIQSGLVSKDYMTWCNGTLRNETLRELNNLKAPTRLVSWAVKNRDYCFMGPVFAKTATKEMLSTWVRPQAHEEAPKDSIFIPGRLTIPRGRILIFGSMCDHFALSTGKRVLLKTQKASEHFGTMWGHGMIELDGNTGTLKEGAIEDLWMCKPNYLWNVLTAAPFPSFSQGGSVELRLPGDDKKKQTVANKRRELRHAKRKTVEAEMSEAANKKKAERDPYLVTRTQAQNEKDETVKNGASANALSGLDEKIMLCTQKLREIDAEWESKETALQKKLKDAEAEADKEYEQWEKDNPVSFATKTIPYAPQDPYKGLVQFNPQKP